MDIFGSVSGVTSLKHATQIENQTHRNTSTRVVIRVKKEKRSSSLLVEGQNTSGHPSVFWKRTCCIFLLFILTEFISACTYFDQTNSV